MQKRQGLGYISRYRRPPRRPIIDNRNKERKPTMFDLFNMLKKDETKPGEFKVTRETIIGDVLDMDNTTAPYFMEIGMHCLGCPASRGESIEEACAVHGVNCDELIEKLNAHFAAKG